MAIIYGLLVIIVFFKMKVPEISEYNLFKKEVSSLAGFFETRSKWQIILSLHYLNITLKSTNAPSSRSSGGVVKNICEIRTSLPPPTHFTLKKYHQGEVNTNLSGLYDFVNFVIKTC